MDASLEKRALEIWREREIDLPPRVRRMNPDALDMASGAWWACLMKAAFERHAHTQRGPQNE